MLRRGSVTTGLTMGMTEAGGCWSAVKLGLSSAKADKSGTLTNHIPHKQNKRLKKLKLKKLKIHH